MKPHWQKKKKKKTIPANVKQIVLAWQRSVAESHVALEKGLHVGHVCGNSVSSVWTSLSPSDATAVSVDVRGFLPKSKPQSNHFQANLGLLSKQGLQGKRTIFTITLIGLFQQVPSKNAVLWNVTSIAVSLYLPALFCQMWSVDQLRGTGGVIISSLCVISPQRFVFSCSTFQTPQRCSWLYFRTKEDQSVSHYDMIINSYTPLFMVQ